MTFAVLVLERLQGILVGAVVILQVLLLHVGFTYTSPHTKGIEQNKFSVVFWHDVTVFFLFAATLYNLLRVIAAAPVTSTAQQVLTAQVTHMTTSGLPTAQYTTDLHPRLSFSKCDRQLTSPLTSQTFHSTFCAVYMYYPEMSWC